MRASLGLPTAISYVCLTSFSSPLLVAPGLVIFSLVVDRILRRFVTQRWGMRFSEFAELAEWRAWASLFEGGRTVALGRFGEWSPLVGSCCGVYCCEGSEMGFPGFRSR